MSGLKSMTGFGSASFEVGTDSAGESGARYGIELRSVNSRHRDVRVRTPWEGLALETRIHRRLAKAVLRGRLDVSIRASREPTASPLPSELPARFRSAARQLATLVEDVDGVEGPVRPADVLAFARAVGDRDGGSRSFPAGAESAIDAAVDEALAALQSSRAKEGEEMEVVIRDLAGEARAAVERVAGFAADQPKRYAERLSSRVTSLLEAVGNAAAMVDKDRLAVEVALLADRSDLTEELVRLRTHLDRLGEILGRKGPHGRKVEFLLQEIHREVNTIGSKASDSRINAEVVELKSTFEKIREVIQNVE